MICDYCQKSINGEKIRVKQGFLKLDRVTGKHAYSSTFYHKERYLVISQKRKKEHKRGLIFIALVIFVLIIYLLAISFNS